MKLNVNAALMLTGLLLFAVLQVYGQDVLIEFEEESPFYETKVSKAKPGVVFDTQVRRFAPGLEGRALDLTNDASLRMPILIKESLNLPYGEGDSFGVSFWVKTKKNALQGSLLAGNKKAIGKEEVGWMINATLYGGWELYISDGKSEYVYQPTLAHQQINDGDWHQIAFSIDRTSENLFLFFDGEQKGIYNIPGLGNLQSELKTGFGGTAGNWDYLGQWEAFNGYLDNIAIVNGGLTRETLAQAYQKHYPQKKNQKVLSDSFKLMSWNIWHGGHRFGKQVGLERVIETIKSHNPDIITLIETYGSVEEIADALGYHFYLISSNLSILSKYPVKNTIKAFRPFNFGGVLLDLPGNKELVVLDTWLHYLPDYQKSLVEDKLSPKELIVAEGETRHKEVVEILKQINPYLQSADETPIIMSGDFNIESHLDWTSATKDLHHGYEVAWPVTLEMEKAGFVDSFREAYPNPLESPGFTFWPFYRGDGSDYIRPRIDYIFYKGNKLKMVDSKVVDKHPVMFPSDHAAVLTEFVYQ
jgi:exonuclease III